MRHVRQILALLLTLTLLLSVTGMGETTQGTATPAVEAATGFVQGEGTTDEATTDEGEALAEPIDDIASELMPVIYNPNCKHKQTKAVSKLVKCGLQSSNAKTHTYLGQRITGRKCTKCGAWTEYVAGGYEAMPTENHKFHSSEYGRLYDYETLFGYVCDCGYVCQHPNAISYKWENIPAKQIGRLQCQYVSPTQHNKPVSGRRRIATVKCNKCGENWSVLIYTELKYELTAHTFDVDDEDYCDGCRLYIYDGECVGNGYHDYQPSETYTFADTYSYVSKDICRGKGIHKNIQYECSKCGHYGPETESYEQNATQDFTHDYLTNGRCGRCRELIECEHEHMVVENREYSDLIAGLEPIKNNGNETHSGKVVETVESSCPDCDYTSTEQRVVDGTQACEFVYYEYDEELGGYTDICKACGAIKRDDANYDKEFSCPHGGADVVRETYEGFGSVNQNDDGKTHTYAHTRKITQYYCPICGYWEETEEVDTPVITEPHDFTSDHFRCRVCKYDNVCEHAHTIKKAFVEDRFTPGIKESNEATHTYLATFNEVCEDCGAILDWDVDDLQLVTEPHTFDVTGVCALCKYVKDNPKTYPVTQLTLSQTTLKLDKDQTATLTATVTPDYATVGDVTWSSDKPEVATVENGTIHALTYGVANISCTANDGSGIKANCKVTVAAVKPNKVTITAQTNKINIGETLQLGVTFKPENAASELTWKSSAPKVATVDPASGLVTGVAQGKATITVTTANKKTASTVIRVVDPTLPTGITLDKTGRQDLNLGDALSLTATLEPADTVQSDIKWTSSDEKIATVEGTGLNATVTPVAEGVAVITAKAMKPNAAGERLTATVRVKVVNPYKPQKITIDQTAPVELTLGGEGVQLTATLTPENAITDVVWVSSDERIARVDRQSGFVTPGRKGGKATITVKTTEKDANGKKQTDSIVVTVIDPKVPTGIAIEEAGPITLQRGETLKLNAIITPDTAIDDKLTWTSSDKTIAKVNQQGIVTALKRGTVNIKVKTSNGLVARISITVVKPSPAPTETPAPMPTEAPSPTSTEAPTETPSPTPESTPTPAPTEAPAQQPEDEPSAEVVQEPTPEPVPEQAPESDPEPAPSTEQATGPTAEPAAEPAADVPEAQTEELTETTE